MSPAVPPSEGATVGIATPVAYSGAEQHNPSTNQEGGVEEASEPTSVCPHCQAVNPNTFAFCMTCGGKLQVFNPMTADTVYPGQTVIVSHEPIVKKKSLAESIREQLNRLFLLRRARRNMLNPPAAIFPFSNNRHKYDTCIPLLQTFRFIHEPIGISSQSRFIGRQNEMEALAKRILFSEGGAFLVTGYRGVGKTSFINQVIRKLEEALPWAEVFLGKTEIIDIYLNVARPVQPSEIMHYIIRSLHDRLIEKRIYHKLDAELREAITLAYHRTSLNMARKLAESSERSFGFNEASIGGDFLKAAVKMSWSSKRSRTQNYEMSYLGYDDKAAEHDIISLCRRIAAGYIAPLERMNIWKILFSRARASRVGLKIVFVFDELDKLEEFSVKGDKDEKPVIDQILGVLKNLFTTSGVTFVFVAGKDLQERWLEDVGKGDSVYESVFSYDKYLPCLWADTDSICDKLVDESHSLTPYEHQIFEEFKKYLAYKGRGIPRRIIRTFNEYAEWDGEQPKVVFTWQNIRKIRFFAGLQDILGANEKLLFGDSHEEVLGTQSDKRRLGVYYLIDWVLRQGASEFMLKDLLNASKRLSRKIALAEEIAPHIAENIIKILLTGNYIQEVEKANYRVFIGDANAINEENIAEKKKYRLTPRRLAEMGGLAPDDEAEVSVTLPKMTGSLDRRTPITSIGKYRIISLIGQGGMGTVYMATDPYNGRKVAIKLMSDDLMPELRVRFEREARIMNELNHPNIVRLYDWGEDNGRIYIAMEYLDGSTLAQMIDRQGNFSLDLVIAIMKPLIEAIHHIHQKGFVRNDIKPNNIILTSTGRVCLVDFGITRPANWRQDQSSMFVTHTGIIIGTPQFMAPEQFRDNYTADERSDIYSLGVILYKMLSGVYPFDGKSLPQIMYAQSEQDPAPPSSYVPLPSAIDEVTLKCLEKDPDKRFQSVAELGEALDDAAQRLPEADLKLLINVVQEEVKEIEKIDRMITIAPDSIVRLGPPVAPQVEGDTCMLAPVAPPPTFDTVVAQSARPEVGDLTPSDLRTRLTLVRGRSEDVDFQITVISNSYLLEKDTTFGRSSENDIILRDVKVSRYHGQFTLDGESWFIEDFNSSVGTYVNGEKIITPRLLNDADEIFIGGFVFRFNQYQAINQG